MNYEGLLSQLTDDKLSLYVPEELPSRSFDVSSVSRPSRSEASTPARKISSSRFINAFTQLYAGPGAGEEESPPSSSASTSAGRTPTKGMETKLLSMWHNVKYGWSGKIRSNFSKEQPVWLLGRCYHRKCTPPSSMESSAELTANLENKATIGEEYQIEEPHELGMDAIENQNVENPWEEGIEGFKRDFFSRIWMTYRREFPTMNDSNYTSDCGWGCMLRSGQMLLSQALICHFLGRSWRWDPETQLHSTYDDNMHRKIIRWFGDSSSRNSPFSIHTLVNLGQEMGKKPGDWYGPSSVSYLLRQAMKQAAQENADLDNIVVYVAKDCTVYIQDILDECVVPEISTKVNVPWQQSRKTSNGARPETSNERRKAVIILIPLRLGTEKLNPIYAHCLKLLLSTEYCIGIIGGRPKHSLYFVGFQEDKLIHLDPHYCQEMVDVNQENFPVHSFHCKSPRKLKASKMDPSCCIGFYCQNKVEFDNFMSSVQMYLHPMRFAQHIDKPTPTAASADPSTAASNSQQTPADIGYPIFSFSRGRSTEVETDDLSETLYKPLQQQLAQYRQEMYATDDDDNGETEEFVIL